MSRASVVSRRSCSLCKRYLAVTHLIQLDLEWAPDLLQEQLLCEACRWEVPAEVLADVPHIWRAVA